MPYYVPRADPERRQKMWVMTGLLAGEQTPKLLSLATPRWRPCVTIRGLYGVAVALDPAVRLKRSRSFWSR